jgi:transcriptional regulator with XRE-family HTH domain
MGQTEKNQQRKDFNHHLGRRIADRRLETGHSAVETGHSAAELDRVLSLNPGSIAAFESGRRSIGAGLLFTLGLALGVPMEFFIGDAPELPGALPDGLPPPETIAEAELFISAFYKIGDVGLRRDILGFVEATSETDIIGRDG